MNPVISIVWFRLDLRLTDHPALTEAARRGAVAPVFIWAPEEESPWEPGAASRWWLHQSLKALAASLRDAGAPLIIRKGPTLPALRRLAQETGASAVFWCRRYEPAVISRDAAIKSELRKAGLEAQSFNGALLREPWEVSNKSGKPFQVFTPFWRHCLAQPGPADPMPAPRPLRGLAKNPESIPLSELSLEPSFDWAQGLRETWRPGEAGAKQRLADFFIGSILNYTGERNRPDRPGTSRLSPHLHFGEVSPRQVWQAASQFAQAAAIPASTWRGWSFLSELGWREFAHHLLFHFPRLPEQPLREEFADFPWRRDPGHLRLWQRGQTGFPFVDAGMRELWRTGWMHNRARMVAASFLVKDLFLPWQDGARWFWDTLVDADLAQNTLGWQWTAGCGPDAAPFFRVFNPAAQGEKFDPDGTYIRRWAPELAKLPAEWIFTPSDAPEPALRAAGVELDRTYPRPIVNHKIAREIALQAYANLRKNG